MIIILLWATAVIAALIFVLLVLAMILITVLERRNDE